MMNSKQQKITEMTKKKQQKQENNIIKSPKENKIFKQKGKEDVGKRFELMIKNI